MKKLQCLFLSIIFLFQFGCGNAKFVYDDFTENPKAIEPTAGATTWRIYYQNNFQVYGLNVKMPLYSDTEERKQGYFLARDAYLRELNAAAQQGIYQATTNISSVIIGGVFLSIVGLVISAANK